MHVARSMPQSEYAPVGGTSFVDSGGSRLPKPWHRGIAAGVCVRGRGNASLPHGGDESAGQFAPLSRSTGDRYQPFVLLHQGHGSHQYDAHVHRYRPVLGPRRLHRRCCAPVNGRVETRSRVAPAANSYDTALRASFRLPHLAAPRWASPDAQGKIFIVAGGSPWAGMGRSSISRFVS